MQSLMSSYLQVVQKIRESFSSFSVANILLSCVFSYKISKSMEIYFIFKGFDTSVNIPNRANHSLLFSPSFWNVIEKIEAG